MKVLRDVDRFDFSIRQLPGFCTPASVASVNKYLMPGSNITQQDIMNEFDRRKPPNTGLGLESMKNCGILANPAFSWADPRYISGNFDMMVQEVRSSIDNDLPHIISVDGGRSGSVQNFHMLTVVGYDDSNFRVHDTQSPLLTNNPRTVPLVNIRSGLSQAHLFIGQFGNDSTDSLVIRRR